MPRIKENFTIDEDLSVLLRNQKECKSSSELVNRILRDHFSLQSDPYHQLNKLDLEIFKLEEKRKPLLETIKKIAEEGNKQEREKAIRRIQEEDLLRDKIYKESSETIELLKETGFFEEFKNCKDMEDFLNLRRKLIKLRPDLASSNLIYGLKLERTHKFFFDSLNPQETHITHLTIKIPVQEKQEEKAK